jgi:2-dehydropantoate 2-reductase
MIYIVGAGAIGKVLAVCLTLANRAVTLLRGSVDDERPHAQTLQVVLTDGTQLQARVEVSTLSHFTKLDGLLVLTNKSYGNPLLAQALRAKAPHSPVVLLQNGLGIEQVFVDQGFTDVYRGVLFVTSQAISAHRLRFKPVSVSPIGTIQGNAPALDAVVAQLDTPHFRFQAQAGIQAVIWKKAIVNSVFNSICPLLEIDNGIFHRQQGVLAMARRVVRECVAVANQQGMGLTEEEVLASLLAISRASDGQLISTLQDIRNKRRTEIDTLNLAIAGIATTLGREDLVKETRLLGELTKWKSELSQ